MRVLAIDASLRNTGVAVIDGDGREPRALYFGTIQTPVRCLPHPVWSASAIGWLS